MNYEIVKDSRKGYNLACIKYDATGLFEIDYEIVGWFETYEQAKYYLNIKLNQLAFGV